MQPAKAMARDLDVDPSIKLRRKSWFLKSKSLPIGSHLQSFHDYVKLTTSAFKEMHERKYLEPGYDMI